MANFQNDFSRYVAETFNHRLKELGLSKNRFVNTHIEFTNRPTLMRILRGEGGANINTVAHYADLLGLEIIIRPKTNPDNEYSGK